LVAWASKSGSSFANDCQVLPHDTDIDFCSDSSVIFSILSIIYNVIAVLSFVLVYFNRFDFKVKALDYDEKATAQKQFAKSLKEKDEENTTLNRTLTQAPIRSPPSFSKQQTVIPLFLSEERPLSKRTRRTDADEDCSLCRQR
jgi:hypothetical protein